MNSNNYVGTRWHKCDLHLHTPASRCFQDTSVTAEEWVQAALDKNLSCVAVTDHNTGEWIDQIKAAAEGTGLTVFPGVEITCSDAKVHLLIIFDVEKTTSDIEDFLLKAHIERKMFGEQTAHSKMSCEDVTSLATGRGAIVIPAHIDEYNGICEMGNQPKVEFLARKEIKGVQVVHKAFTLSDNQYNNEVAAGLKDKLNDYYGAEPQDIAIGKLKVDNDRMKTWRQAVKKSEGKAILTFSDNPHEAGASKHGIWGIGTRYTWMKMDAVPSLEGIRQALLVPEERIINDFDIDDDKVPYELPDIWIEKISFSNTEVTELEKEIAVDFSPQMTSIVGGRGSGKSTILRLLRGLFPMYREQLDDVPSIKNDFDNFFKEPDKRNKNGVLNSATCIDLIIHRKNTKYKLCYKQAEVGLEAKIYRHRASDDSWTEETDEGFINFFDLDIFSQKQVFEIANRPNALRNKIDNDIEGVAEIKQQLKQLESGFLAHTAHIRELETEISAKTRLETEINDIETRLASLDIEELKTMMAKRQQFGKEEDEIFEFKKNLRDQLESILGEVENLSVSKYDLSIAQQGEYVDEVESLVSPLVDNINLIQEQLKQLVENGISNLETFEDDIYGSKWSRDKSENEDAFDDYQEKLEEEGMPDLSDPKEIELEMESARKKRNKITQIEVAEKELEIKLEKRSELKKEYLEKREKLTLERRKFLRQILKDDVKAAVVPCGDMDNFETSLREIMNAHNSYTADFQALVEMWQHRRSAIDNNESFWNIYKSILEGSYTGELSNKFQNKIRGLDPAQVDKLDLLVPEDKIEVSYKSNARSNFRPIATASPGQKTAAILTFLLSHGERPLIIDQPEDDLDTSLINSLVVSQLRGSKNRRQVIVVTHNPNIPVNGDSEYIVVMNSESKYIEPKHAGSIDDLTVRELICDVMEGGVEAFNLRSQRYKLS